MTFVRGITRNMPNLHTENHPYQDSSTRALREIPHGPEMFPLCEIEILPESNPPMSRILVRRLAVIWTPGAFVQTHPGCTHLCIYICLHICIYTQWYVCIYIYIYVHTHVCMYIYIYIYTHVYIYIHIYIYKYTYYIIVGVHILCYDVLLHVVIYYYYYYNYIISISITIVVILCRIIGTLSATRGS